MKIYSRLIASIMVGLFAVATFGAIAVNNNNNNANQALASEGNYYNSVTSDMSGTALLNQLHTIVNSGNISVSYDWSRYEDADEDPNNSNNVILIYARNSVAKSAHVSGSTGWNREHTFPQSKMDGGDGSKSDNHIIFASDNKVNGNRSNKKMGVVTGGTISKDYFGNNTTCRYTDSLFDPNNVARGIVARSTMYAAAMYNYDPEDNFESIATMLQWHLNYPVDSFDTGRNETVYTNQHNRNPFVDHPEYACRIWGSTNSTTKSICGISDKGITSISKTSATIAQGSSTTISATSSNSGTISWSSSNTSVATVSSATAASGSNITIIGISAGSATITASITISGQTYTKTCAVTVTAPKNLSSISISGQKTSFTVGATFSFGGTVTAHYSDSTTANVTNSATFSGYNMNTEGQQTVTVSYTEGNTTRTTTYTITVSASGGGGSSSSQRIVSKSGSEYYEDGDIVFSGGGSSATTSCSAFSVTWLKNSGTNNINLTYDEMRVYASHSFTITPNTNYSITSVVITANSASYASAVGGSNLSNCTKAVNGTTVTLTPTNGDNAVGFTNNAQSRLNYVVVNYESSGSTEPTLNSISLDTTNVNKTFTVGDTFSYEGLIVTAHYSDNTNPVIESGYQVSTPNMSTTGTKIVTVTYNGKSATYQITVNEAAPTSITASVSKTYYVGEAITSDDITVKDNNNNTVTGFSFANNNYQFKYDDASSGGALTNKTFTNAVSYNNMTCSLTVQVQRKARITPSTEDYSVTYTDLPTSYQTSTSERTAASGIKFIAYNLANYSSKMQFKASGGYFQTTQAMALKTVTINNRETNALTVYGSTNGSSFSNTITGTNDVYNLTGYSYVKIMKNGSGAAYCSSIAITIGASDSAINLANYIMYEDTPNQCQTKLDIAIGYLHDLSSTEKNSFKTSNDYVIKTARERLEAWALNQGKTIDYTNGALTRSINPFIENIDSNSVYIIIIVGVAALSTIGCYFFLRRKEH